MERRNYLLLRLIASFEIAIIYTLVLLFSNYEKEIIVDKTTAYTDEIKELDKELNLYNNIEEETNKLYEEYTDNINKLENMILIGQIMTRIFRT